MLLGVATQHLHLRPAAMGQQPTVLVHLLVLGWTVGILSFKDWHCVLWVIFWSLLDWHRGPCTSAFLTEALSPAALVSFPFIIGLKHLRKCVRSLGD